MNGTNGTKTINEMNLAEVNQAINLGELNLRSIRPEYRATVIYTIEALKDRRRRLTATGQKIAAENKALRGGR
jgi:hypothetical protein